MKVCINNRNVKYNRKNRILTSFGNFCETIFTDNNTTIQSSSPPKKQNFVTPHPANTFLKYLEGWACHVLSRTLIMGYSWRNPNKGV